MTLNRLNPMQPGRVIHRTDDSRQIRVAFIGERNLFFDVLSGAIGRSGFTSWWAEWPEGEDPNPQYADLVVISLGRAGYTDPVRRLVRKLAGAAVLAVTIDDAAPMPPGQSWTSAGAIWAVDPTTTSIDDLAVAITAAASSRTENESLAHRASAAAEAWAAAQDSSILTMRRDHREPEHGADRRPVGGGDVGRQQ